MVTAHNEDDIRTFDQEKLYMNNQNAVGSRNHNGAPPQKALIPRWRGKGKEKSSIALACTWVVDHQIHISLSFISTLFLLHSLFPDSRSHTVKFFRISYFNPATGTYALGWNDIWFVFYWIIVFTGVRCVTMDYILSPAAALLGVKSQKARVRFAEQAWILIYPAASWSVGMYILYHSDYWLNLHALWRNWPVREMNGLSKWYYLVQFAFWLQQIVVVNIEERRKDYWQMFSHHIITCALMFGSYGYHFTRVGNLILCLMDVVDLFLPLAKILKYLKLRLACDITFGVFMVTWLINRHIFYLWVLWSIYSHIPYEIKNGCYRGSVQTLTGPYPIPNDWSHLVQPFRDPEGLVCFNNNTKWAFLAMLLALQVILLIWGGMILKVAYKVLSGQGADDVRSDDEEDEEEEERNEKPKVEQRKPLLKEKSGINPVSNAAIDQTNPRQTTIPNRASNTTTASEAVTSTPASSVANPSSSGTISNRTSPRRKEDGGVGGLSSGVNLLAAKDRKDLLGRIGCDTKVGGD